MNHGNIVITGVSSGIGLHCAKKFIMEGYRVFGSVRKPEDAARLSDELGEDFQPLTFDVTDAQTIEKAVSEVYEVVKDDGIALLINNAGIAVTGPVKHLPIDDFRFQFEVNFFGLISVTKAFLPLLGGTKNGLIPPGKIINISSVSGELAFPFMSPYVASKHAVEGFSKALRMELMLYGIDVIVIAPGAIKTPIWTKVEPLDPEILQSDYGPVIEKFQKQVLREAEDAMPVRDLAQQIYRVFIDKKPKTRYAILNQKWTKWIIPRYLMPARMLDNFVRKMFFRESSS